MAVGLTLTKDQFDSRIGSQSLQVLQVMQQWTALKKTVDAMQTDDLEALGYSADDVTLIRAAMEDTGKILAIFTGQEALAEAYDFTQNIGKLAGFGY